MKYHVFHRCDRARWAERAAAVTCLIVPGLDGSGAGHWQTVWETTRTDCTRAELGRWSDPHLQAWRDGLDAAVSATEGPIVFAAHSLGCFAVAWWLATASAPLLAKVRGALLVAPPDVERPNVDARLRRFAPTPIFAARVPTLLVASRDDPYASFERSRAMAELWGARLVDVGELGHINADSGLGAWEEGQDLLSTLTDERESDRVLAVLSHREAR
jgi:predicted alpha/beta hydrolase family esterase